MTPGLFPLASPLDPAPRGATVFIVTFSGQTTTLSADKRWLFVANAGSDL